jgi:FkbM family methyltransferase
MHLLRSDKGISASLMRPGYWKRREQAFMSIIRREVSSSDFVCEIGANIGFVTLLLSSLVGASGRVLAIEPDPRTRVVLRQNVALNSVSHIVHIQDWCISDVDGVGHFLFSPKTNLSRVSSSGPAITLKTLDTALLPAADLPVFYKLDVEGHEAAVLRGAQSVLQTSPPGTKILMEIHPTLYDPPDSLALAVKPLLRLGFFFRYVISAGVRFPDQLRKRGYVPDNAFRHFGLSDDFPRAVFGPIANDDGLFLCHPHRMWVPGKERYSPKIIRSIMLEKE